MQADEHHGPRYDTRRKDASGKLIGNHHGEDNREYDAIHLDSRRRRRRHLLRQRLHVARQHSNQPLR